MAAACVGAAALVAAIATAFVGPVGLVVSAAGLLGGVALSAILLREQVSRLTLTAYEKEVLVTRQAATLACLVLLLAPLLTVASIGVFKALLPEDGETALGHAVGGIFSLACGLLAGRYLVSARTMSQRGPDTTLDLGQAEV